MTALYNEIEPFVCDWLENLISAGHIEHGRVERRSIADLAPGDCAPESHFFAGIGVWSYALKLAEWPVGAPVWTGSCPCQPFSQAGRRAGKADERHLWPAWLRLIRECRPPVVLGEQVASADGLDWLDTVCADLEGAGYAVGAADLCAAGVGAPHIRQRLFFVAHTPGWRLADAGRLAQLWPAHHDDGHHAPGHDADGRGETRAHGGAVGHACGEGLQVREREELRGSGRRSEGRAVEQPSGARREAHPARVGNSRSDGVGEHAGELPRDEGQHDERPALGGDASVFAGATRGFWARADWLPCRDGKARPVEPGSFPLAHGAPARVGRLRAYGNAINAEVAATFIRAVMEVLS